MFLKNEKSQYRRHSDQENADEIFRYFNRWNFSNKLYLFLLLSILVTESSYSQVPVFEKGIKLEAGGYSLNPGFLLSGELNRHSVPCEVDWNEDGKKDLLVGAYNTGSIYLYLNTGDDNDAVFDSEIILKDSKGSDIIVDYG